VERIEETLEPSTAARSTSIITGAEVTTDTTSSVWDSGLECIGTGNNILRYIWAENASFYRVKTAEASNIYVFAKIIVDAYIFNEAGIYIHNFL
jgi:hypothetical protein